MLSFNYKKYNVIIGWLIFAVAMITYALTLEPTVSYWDCGEYISTAEKLEVGHPPGAPLFQMLGAFFAMFATDVTQIAKMVNFMSALASAFTILFLFWTITALAKKVIKKTSEELDLGSSIAILGSGTVGALAYTFSDSFWFSAVEAEVYAMSSFLMALLLWLGLRWEAEMDKPRGNKWLILISLVVGLSFGVHILSLLVIPSIVFIYYFKKYPKITFKDFFIANIVSVLVLAFVFKFLFPFTLMFFSKLEIFFVNTVRLPFNSGSIIAALLLISGFYYGLKYTRKKNYETANLLVLCVMFIMIGFSSWLMLPIRANANTAINENNPSSARELLAYYNREQYGDSNVFYDNFYTTVYDMSKVEKNGREHFLDGKPKYEKDKKIGRYVIVNKNDYKNSIPDFGTEHKGFIPRMVDQSPGVIEEYIAFTGSLPKFKLKSIEDVETYLNKYYGDIGNKELAKYYGNLKYYYDNFMKGYEANEISRGDYMKYLNENKEFLNVQKPSFGDNMYFMMNYQFGYMYGRYFMWNFVGKQDDMQGHLVDNHGNWLSGIKLIDEIHLGSQDNLPKEILENKGRNTYYFLPLLLGLLGLFFHLFRDEKNFYMLLLFFAFTGLAVIFYTNPKPFEPRERDYAVVGSFYIFAVWIGFGVLALFEFFKKFMNPKILASVVTLICLFAVPILMASENWDDHDRSNRYTARLNSKAYLDSCQENAIMFTIGDNDTFPLWYMQEVEGYRTDIKLVNTSLFATDWYIDQQKRKTYKADPIPGKLTHDQYRTGKLDAAYHRENYKAIKSQAVKDYNQVIHLDSAFDTAKKDKKDESVRVDIKYFMSWIASDKKITKEDLAGNGHQLKTYPTNKIRLMVDKEAVLKNGIVAQKDADLIVPYIDIDIDPYALSKNRILMLDILANNNWERPIYFTGGAFADEEYIWLKDYLQLDGLAYKLVPIKTPIKGRSPMDLGRINTDVMYKNIKGLDWKNSNDSNLYVDEETRKNSISYRNNLNRLAEAFIAEKKYDKAEEMLDLSVEKLPIKTYKHYSLSLGLVDNYYAINKKDKAKKVAAELISVFQDKLNYYISLDDKGRAMNYDDIETNLLMYSNVVETVTNNDKAYAEELLEFALKTIPFEMYAKERFALTAIESYYKLEKREKAQDLSKRLTTSYNEEIKYLTSLDQDVYGNQIIDKIKPVIEFYQFVMNENELQDSVFYRTLRDGYEDTFKEIEKALK
jgi:hypothetical protein